VTNREQWGTALIVLMVVLLIAQIIAEFHFRNLTVGLVLMLTIVSLSLMIIGLFYG
jgi:hypothetical protein